LVILYVCISFSHDANDAFNTSVNFLFVPGVSGGICVGTSVEEEEKKAQIKHKKNRQFNLIEFM
jgi:hypothetical protein